jgi:hypothetical protein
MLNLKKHINIIEDNTSIVDSQKKNHVERMNTDISKIIDVRITEGE